MNNRKPKLFIACNSKEVFFKELIVISQNKKIRSFNYIFLENNISWEEIAKTADQCIGAIVIASNDKPENTSTSNVVGAYRSNENIWLELGWLLARFGASRVMLLKHSSVELPERIKGANYIEYNSASAEIKFKEVIKKILETLTERSVLEVPEVLSVSHAERTHFENWERMRLEAIKELVITGISMGNIQKNLQLVFQDTVRRSESLKVKFIVLDPRYAANHREMLDVAHRENAVQDNHSFFRCLHEAWLELETSQQKRVNLYLLRSFIPAFAAHIADGEEVGGLILLQILIPKEKSPNIMNYPRLLLIRRSRDGAFIRVLNSIKTIENQSEFFNISLIPDLLHSDT